MLGFESATPEDAVTLAEVSKRAFHHDIHYGAPGPGLGGPPGYDSDKFQIRMMMAGMYYKILYDGRIIGGFMVRIRGYQYYELGRIFIELDYQNQGIGTQAFEFMWREFPEARMWMLGTPSWNKRTRHFYEKLGFVEVGRERDPEGWEGILFEKRIAPPSPADRSSAERRSGSPDRRRMRDDDGSETR